MFKSKKKTVINSLKYKLIIIIMLILTIFQLSIFAMINNTANHISEIQIEKGKELLLLLENTDIDIDKLFGHTGAATPFTKEGLQEMLNDSKDASEKMLHIFFRTGVFSLVFFFVLAYIFASWAIRPVNKAFESQKQFIGDASHELKTPLTILSANTDILQSEIGENNWLISTKEEIKRMNLLVQDLLYLAKSDSDEIQNIMESFNFSKAITSMCLSFESVVFEDNKKLLLEIENDIYLNGDEAKIKQVIAILLDNAIKHTNDGGEIIVSLKMSNSKKHLIVYNTGEGISEKDIKKIFERFYRSDTSRARETGGTGLGLSIAKAIVEQNNGKIAVESEFGKWVRFSVAF